jgi:hypothetical protein
MFFCQSAMVSYSLYMPVFIIFVLSHHFKFPHAVLNLQAACGLLVCCLQSMYVFVILCNLVCIKIFTWYQKAGFVNVISIWHKLYLLAAIQLTEECHIKNKAASSWWTFGRMHADYKAEIKTWYWKTNQTKQCLILLKKITEKFVKLSAFFLWHYSPYFSLVLLCIEVS